MQLSAAGEPPTCQPRCRANRRSNGMEKIRDGSPETRASACRNLGPALGLFLLFTLPAIARDLGQWDNQPIAVRQWFQSLMQPDNPYVSCCGEADAFEADTFEVS